MNFLSSLLLAAGVAVAGYFVADGLRQLHSADRYVSVKGLAEREVGADLVVWPISFVEAGNQLPELYARLERNAGLVREFLKKSGIDQTDVRVSPPKHSDHQAEGYSDQRSNFRYRAESTLTVRSRKPDVIKAAMQQAGELVKEGIVFTDNYGASVEYLFTGLNDIKPALIAEATQNARRAAEQFAKDSNSKVGGIRTASQGQITITDRDAGTPDIKVVRVVTTVDYALKAD